ncbi:Uncharacterised protein [Mycobacteroides abscessus subsp. abscessus]|nr:Uncharacterised protein [Mycobacteroides abscessus subsp. abscessus]SKR84369.1 Uncharacterised protein [Mycobacteroides abscessus subsp. abscessus]SLJ15650.1 Uncharacterised protein [Mycobacteroides abscessus subsp. abscessus]
MAGKLRSKQWNRDVPGLDGGKETHHIVNALRGQNGHPIAGLGYLLEPRGNGPRTLAKLRPVEIVGFAVRVGVEVQIPVGERVAQLFHGTLKVVVDGITVWQGDSTFAVQVLLNTQLHG